MATQTSDARKGETAQATAEMAQPIIIDLGKQKPEKLRDLKEGEGELWDEVLEVIQEAKEMLGAEAQGKLLLPLVMIYEKRGAPRIEKLLFPLADLIETNTDDDDEEEDD
jgi:hypothetical protein